MAYCLFTSNANVRARITVVVVWGVTVWRLSNDVIGTLMFLVCVSFINISNATTISSSNSISLWLYRQRLQRHCVFITLVIFLHIVTPLQRHHDIILPLCFYFVTHYYTVFRKRTPTYVFFYIFVENIDLHKIFRVCLWGIKYFVDIKIKYSLLPMT